MERCLVKAVAVIGDVHGDARKLDALLRLIPDRYYVFVGDVVNRGPDTRTVLETILKLKSADRATLVRGNHELTVLSYWQGVSSFVEFALAGGIPTLRSYVPEVTGDVWNAFRAAFPRDHRELLEQAVDEFQLEGAVVRHWDHEAQRVLTRGNVARAQSDLLVVGHTVIDRARRIGDVVFLDSGCGTTDGELSALLLPEDTIISTG